MKFLLLATIIPSCGSLHATETLSAQARYVAPTNQAELDTRISDLRQQYAPCLRSLPEPLPMRERTTMPLEWEFTFEAKATIATASWSH